MDEVLKFLDNEFKKKKAQTIVLGISGGPDSMALINIFLNIRKKYNLTLICAHVHHNLRDESDQEKKDVELYCENNDIKFEWTKIETYGKGNLHSEGRNKRYIFFEELVKKYKASYLVTAHHGDDLVETIMMRIVRGSTLKGYSGFQKTTKKPDYKIIRPLIYVTKEELIDYLNKNNIKYAVDNSNFDDEYTRNRYRKTILPFLKEENKNVHLKFLKYSEIIGQYSDFIDKIIEKEKQNVVQNSILDIIKFEKLESVVKTKIIYSLLETAYNEDLFLIDDNHVNLIFDLIKSNKANSRINLPNNLCFVKEYDKMYIQKNDLELITYQLEINNIVSLPNGKQIKQIEDNSDNSNYVIRLNSKDLLLPLFVRSRKNGDKMIVKKLNGSKKINDIFIDSKIPLKQRETWPIVTDANDNILWLPGLKKSEFDKSNRGVYDIILYYF